MSTSDENESTPSTILQPGVEAVEDLGAGETGGVSNAATSGTGGDTGSLITTTSGGTTTRIGDTLDTYTEGTSGQVEDEVAKADTS